MMRYRRHNRRLVNHQDHLNLYQLDQNRNQEVGNSIHHRLGRRRVAQGMPTQNTDLVDTCQPTTTTATQVNSQMILVKRIRKLQKRMLQQHLNLVKPQRMRAQYQANLQPVARAQVQAQILLDRASTTMNRRNRNT